MFVVEAVRVFAVFFGGEGVIAARDTTLVDFEGVGGCLDLRASSAVAVLWARNYPRGCWRTQKSISKLPLPPNSRSPTWKVTVILSSLCRASWKHSRWWAFIWMLCADAADSRLLAAANSARDGNSMPVVWCGCALLRVFGQ